MTEVDPRFIGEGRSLREWLPELLSGDASVRHRAENALSAMYWGTPIADASAFRDSPADPEAHRQEWGRAVEAAINAPAFAGVALIKGAFAQMRADAQMSHELRELEQQVLDSDDPVESPGQQATLDRIRRLRELRESGRLANSLGQHTLHVAVEYAGRILLGMPDEVRAALVDGACQEPVAKALGRLGPPAVEFAPDLVAMADRASQSPGFRFPQVLASIGAGDERTVRALLSRVRPPSPLNVAWAAAETLKQMGPRASATMPSLVDGLLLLLGDTERDLLVLSCLAAIAPHREDVFERVLAHARPAPPRMRQVEGNPQWQYDEAMHSRGWAIDALREFGRLPQFAARAVPVLTEALDTFEEYDPDWGYSQSQHARVIASLRCFGPAAVGAVEALARHVRQQDGDLDVPVIRLLGELGSTAAMALPALRRLQAELADERAARGYEAVEPPDALAQGSDAEPDPQSDPLNWAIWRLQG